MTINHETVNHERVIDWQLAQLQHNDNSPMPQEMADHVREHPELAAELHTLKAFWQPQELPPQPSPSLRAGFYDALSGYQKEHEPQNSSQPTRQVAANDSLFQQVWVRAAVIALVFVLGIFTGREGAPDQSQQAVAALQDEVSSLSTLMAISMLQQDSASQRLAGVSYARQANMTDPALVDTLMNSLIQEKSTAVKLAIVGALGKMDGLQNIEQSLVEYTLNETQPLVQMALTQMLVTSASDNIRIQLIQQLKAQPVDQDVQEFLQLIDAQNRI